MPTFMWGAIEIGEVQREGQPVSYRATIVRGMNRRVDGIGTGATIEEAVEAALADMKAKES